MNNNIEYIYEVPNIEQIGEEIVEVIVKYNESIEYIENELNVEIEILGFNYAIITIKANQIRLLYNYKEIEYIELPKNLTYNLNYSTNKSCINTICRIDYNLSGKGVIVGIIDSGIDYLHPDFRNEDGTTRILYIWDQTTPGTPPTGFDSGSEYDSAIINKAINSENPYDIVPEVDTLGHGTAVSGVAAGNGRASNFTYVGVANNSNLIVVKLGQKGRESFFLTTEVMRALKYAVDKAEKLNMPISINLSFGTNNGGHDGSSLFETYIDSISQKWKTNISISTGNEGYAGHHIAGKIGKGEMKEIDFAVSDNLSNLYITMWKNFADTFSYEIGTPSGKVSERMTAQNRFIRLDLDEVTLYARMGQPNHYNFSQEIYFFFNGNKGKIPVGIWKIRIYCEELVDGNFNLWLPTIEEVSLETAFGNPTTTTTLTIPSTSLNAISVGGYNATNDTSAIFSGQGYTRKNVFEKPDLVAPAVGIITAERNGGYGLFSGTSVAAPFVTGAIALMMEWGIVNKNDPFLYGQRIKAFLRKGARRKQDITYPNTIWGYGELCLLNSLNYLIKYQGGD